MRLKSIKLAGFKSFVDPTTVNFPSNMAAVVGPNGCGKSNIIDAVRWVMGESSAKNLRGESMTDVIFNGSNTRKPVSQASIELIFDNAETTLVGEYAQYAEISIRRRVSRDGQNTYFLNGTKCRRRDITDIFLGTGLGPRSYSIIEQGMISKLIEARPEDLRNFIEEAAGISKYKERRRETESRIRRTQENLARLTDLREELGRQLERLHRQAQSAEKYQEHKAEERQLKAQLGAVRWRDLNEQVGQRERVIGDQEVAFEALVAEQRGADAGIERLRDGHHELSERFNQVQARFYSVGGDIARVEQSIQHGQQRQRQLQDDLREAERTRQETESHLGHDRTLLATLAEEMAMLAPEQELSAAAAEEAGIALEQAEQGMQAWQQQWDAFNQQSAEPRRQAEVQQSRIQHLEQSLERLQDRERRLQEERGQLAADPEDAAILELNEQVAIAELALEELQLQEQGQAERLEQLRQELQQLAAEQHQAQGELQRLNGRIASLEALQQAKVEQLVLRRRRLDEEVAELAEQRALEQEQLSEARLTLQEALDSMALDTERRESLLAERDALRERLDRIRQDARTHKDHAHQLAVRVGSLKAQHNSTQQALERLDQQSARLNERCEQLNLNLEEGAAPLEELRMKLEELLERRMAVEDELKQARLALEDADRELREVEKRRGQAEQQSQLLRGQLEQQRLEWQGLVVRRKALQEQLAEDGYDLHTVLANLPLDASERDWEERLESLAARIQRLGPINLAAIEEYQQQSERKRYLDSQNDDLAEALETLENVIRKIDRETRNRFKETFDQINAGLQALFPKVFGGGMAYLELTGEDLLDTGVAIMARPPGKKNSTIHLLSGGEKALTALALVFAIFQLNPAPFCMLDEVDAPLDDANVGRYARLVKEMSEKVQFIYITHNKIAMEMADQLMGVTMHEPGCSRLVAVDVEEAVALAEA
ncbi:chromosome segregation protein SMC [Pseudomonas aeruginosa]|nr:chromosome segregation protein SMC [Pseudomonas aeruginosa]